MILPGQTVAYYNFNLINIIEVKDDIVIYADKDGQTGFDNISEFVDLNRYSKHYNVDSKR